MVSTVAGEPGLHYVRVTTRSVESSDRLPVFPYSVFVEVPGKDPFEPNDAYETATEIGPGSYDGITDGTDDVDVFAVPLEKGDDVFVELTFDGAEGDLDLYLDRSDSWTVATSTNAGSVERVSIVAAEAGRYYIWVQPYNVSEAVPYTIDVELIPGADEDPFELNNDFEDATEIEHGTYEAAIRGADDTDVFAISLEEGDEISVRLAYSSPDDLDLVVYDPEFELVTWRIEQGNAKQTSFVASRSGRYYIWIVPNGVSEVPYTLELMTTPRSDEFEPNDVFAEAAVIEPGVYEAVANGLSDSDWYAVYLEEGDELTARFTCDEPSVLEMSLFRPGDDVVFPVTGSSGEESVVASESGLHYVSIRKDRVSSWLPSAGADTVPYTLEVAVTPRVVDESD
jgi:hypothetical protein